MAEERISIQIPVAKKEYWKLAEMKGTKMSWYEFLVKGKVRELEATK